MLNRNTTLSVIQLLVNESFESNIGNDSFESIAFSYPYYGDYLQTYHENYVAIHGYLSLVVCLFGITANILNIIVLSQKNMISPTNAILTGLAVADMLVMFSYLPFSFHNYIRSDLDEQERYSYGWATFALFHGNFTIVNHTISTWLTVTVAIWRFMAVSFPASAVRSCGMPRAKFAIIATYVSSVVICIPQFLSFHVSESQTGGNTTYHVNFSEIAKRHDRLLEKINFWLFGVITKLVPCVALTGLSFGLIRVLYEAKIRRQRLKNRSDSDSAHDRTTKMLLVVLVLFLLTEFPSGLLALLSGILGQEFFRNVYLNFGETMDGLALINSGINFIIYCSMSRQFRDTFALLFIPKILTRTQITTGVDKNAHTVATTCV